MGQLSRLQAVNRMLRGANEPPVQSLDSSPTNESLIAEQILDEVNMKEQMAGMNANTTIIELVPDPVTDQITLPDTTLQVIAWYDEGRGEGVVDSRKRRLIQRGVNPTLLFDQDNNSFQFDAVVTIKQTLLMLFEELPTAQQFRIVDIGARMYEQIVQGDPVMQEFLRQEALHSRALGRAADARSRRPVSFLTGENTISRRANRVPRDWR